jgi:hypothetical protein
LLQRIVRYRNHNAIIILFGIENYIIITRIDCIYRLLSRGSHVAGHKHSDKSPTPRSHTFHQRSKEAKSDDNPQDLAIIKQLGQIIAGALNVKGATPLR